MSLVKATINENEALQNRIKSYRNGGIKIIGDIVNAPLKDLDYVDDSMYKTPPPNTSIAAEPDV